MPDLKQLGERVSELLKARKMSALAASEAAGLSRNQVRNIVLGRHAPTANTLRLIATALNLDSSSASELRQLAGIDPRPGDSSDAKAARRAAWPQLLYLYVNHYLLPRLELADFLAGRGLSASDRDWIGLALRAPTVADFTSDQTCTILSRSLWNRIDATFRDAPLTTITDLPAQTAAVRRDGAHAYRWDELWWTACTLDGFNRPRWNPTHLFNCVHYSTFNYNVAAAIFPPLYWHACRAWPFSKISMPHSYRGEGCQRGLYDAIRAGLSLDGFCAAMLGESDLGKTLARTAIRRRSFEQFEMPGFELPDSHVSVIIGLGDPPYNRTIRRPAIDTLFDQADRNEFLARFPLFAVDRETSMRLVEQSDNAVWQSWAQLSKRLWPWPGDRQPFRADDPSTIFGPTGGRSIDHDAPETLPSLIERQLCEESSAAFAKLIGLGRWEDAAAIAKAAEFDPMYLNVVESIARGRVSPREEVIRDAERDT